MFQNLFKNTLTEKYKEYVKTPFGTIDILTDKYIYEIKYNPSISQLQRALGQLIFYKTFYQISSLCDVKLIINSFHCIKFNYINIKK